MKFPFVSAFLSVLTALAVVSCGVTSRERYEPLSTCQLEKPIDIGAKTPAGITLTNLEFYAPVTSEAIKGKSPQEISFHTVAIAGAPQSLLLGYQVSPGKFGVGIGTQYEGSATPTEVDEEGFTHFVFNRRGINGRVREEGDKLTYKTRLVESASDPKSEKSIATTLRVVIEKNQLIAVEMNWPVTKTEDWREGEALLPNLKMWEWEQHPGANEVVCLKNAAVKTR